MRPAKLQSNADDRKIRGIFHGTLFLQNVLLEYQLARYESCIWWIGSFKSSFLRSIVILQRQKNWDGRNSQLGLFSCFLHLSKDAINTAFIFFRWGLTAWKLHFEADQKIPCCSQSPSTSFPFPRASFQPVFPQDPGSSLSQKRAVAFYITRTINWAHFWGRCLDRLTRKCIWPPAYALECDRWIMQLTWPSRLLVILPAGYSIICIHIFRLGK